MCFSISCFSNSLDSLPFWVTATKSAGCFQSNFRQQKCEGRLRVLPPPQQTLQIYRLPLVLWWVRRPLVSAGQHIVRSVSPPQPPPGVLTLLTLLQGDISPCSSRRGGGETSPTCWCSGTRSSNKTSSSGQRKSWNILDTTWRNKNFNKSVKVWHLGKLILSLLGSQVQICSAQLIKINFKNSFSNYKKISIMNTLLKPAFNEGRGNFTRYYVYL